MLANKLKYFSRAIKVVSPIRTLGSTTFKVVRSNKNERLSPLKVENNCNTIKSVEHDDSFLVIRWNDNSNSRFPYVYLRDLSTGAMCTNDKTQRLVSHPGKTFPLDIRAKNVEVSSNGAKLHISWPDNHTTEFQSQWLHENRLQEKQQRNHYLESSSIAREGVRFWKGSDMKDNVPQFDFQQIMEDDTSLFDWLKELHSTGIALLNDVPGYTTPTASEMLAKRVGYVKPTHYGYIFNVHAKFDANNLAYTTKDLPLHCDIPQSQYYPGLQFLQCLKQASSKGGANMFVDGFYISQQIKNQEPGLFDLLSKAPIPYWDVGKDDYGDFHIRGSRPVFELDHNKKIVRFSYNNHVRDYYLKGSPEMVKEIYRGYIKLGKMLRDPQNKIDHKLKVGEMMTFSNSRVLHGRTAFTPTKTGNRHLQGTYLDWDLAYSRLRSLSRTLGQPFVG